MAERVRNENGVFGFNADAETYGDLAEAGVIDPTKVVRFALQNAASVAALMIDEKPKKKQSAPVTPGADMDNDTYWCELLQRNRLTQPANSADVFSPPAKASSGLASLLDAAFAGRLMGDVGK